MSAEKKAFVIGQNIGHSKSPLIHNYWLKQLGISGHYAIRDLTTQELAGFIDEVHADDTIMGFNVTIPHKETIMNFLDEIDETARAIGAVNTVYKKNGKLVGTNTDAFGFVENLKQHAGSAYAECKRGSVFVYGAGGAAKAILYGLIQDGFTKFYLTNRSVERAKALAKRYEDEAYIKVVDFSVNNFPIDVIMCINTTSMGMKGETPLAPDFTKRKLLALVIDIVYNPLYTEFLNAAKVAGIQPVTGIGMLLHQARPAFQHFFGVLPDVDEDLEKIVLG